MLTPAGKPDILSLVAILSPPVLCFIRGAESTGLSRSTWNEGF